MMIADVVLEHTFGPDSNLSIRFDEIEIPKFLRLITFHEHEGKKLIIEKYYQKINLLKGGRFIYVQLHHKPSEPFCDA